MLVCAHVQACVCGLMWLCVHRVCTCSCVLTCKHVSVHAHVCVRVCSQVCVCCRENTREWRISGVPVPLTFHGRGRTLGGQPLGWGSVLRPRGSRGQQGRGPQRRGQRSLASAGPAWFLEGPPPSAGLSGSVRQRAADGRQRPLVPPPTRAGPTAAGAGEPGEGRRAGQVGAGPPQVPGQAHRRTEEQTDLWTQGSADHGWKL